MDDIGERIGKAVKDRRAELNLTLDDVAEKAGCTRAYIWSLEAGHAKNPGLRLLLKLCSVLGLGLNEMLHEDVENPRVTKKEMALIMHHRRLFGEDAGDDTMPEMQSAVGDGSE